MCVVDPYAQLWNSTFLSPDNKAFTFIQGVNGKYDPAWPNFSVIYQQSVQVMGAIRGFQLVQVAKVPLVPLPNATFNSNFTQLTWNSGSSLPYQGVWNRQSGW